MKYLITIDIDPELIDVPLTIVQDVIDALKVLLRDYDISVETVEVTA